MNREREKHEKLTKESIEKGEMIETIDAQTLSNYIYIQNTKQKLIKWGKYLTSWMPYGTSRGDEMEKVFVPLNMAQIVDDLLAVHGYEIFINGIFNGDPHPGNILYIDQPNTKTSSDYKIGLIDYGQVKRISHDFRLKMAKTFMLTEAAMRYDPRSLKTVTTSNSNVNNIDYKETFSKAKRAVAQNMIDIGFKSENMYDDTMYEMCTVYYGRDDPAWLHPLNFVQWSDMIQQKGKRLNA